MWGGCLAIWPGFLAPSASDHELKSMLTCKSHGWQIDLCCLHNGFTSLHRAVRSQLWHQTFFSFPLRSEYTLCKSAHGQSQKWQVGICGSFIITWQLLKWRRESKRKGLSFMCTRRNGILFFKAKCYKKHCKWQCSRIVISKLKFIFQIVIIHRRIGKQTEWT